METYTSNMKELLKTADPHGAFHLQEELQAIAQAGRAIRGVGGCLSGINRIEPEDKDGDFSYFNGVSCCDLEIAIDLLGKLIEDKGNDLCRRFGLTSDG